MNLTEFLGRLKSVRRNGPGWITLCPAHEDRNPSLSINEDGDKKLAVVRNGVSLQELVNGLNALGIGPRDMITILQAIKAAGALQADIELM